MKRANILLVSALLAALLAGCGQQDFSSTSEPARLPSHAPPGYHSAAPIAGPKLTVSGGAFSKSGASSTGKSTH